MDRVNGKNAVDIGGGRRGYRDQDAVAGIAGTVVTAEWLNSVQEELLKVIEGAGLMPDPKDWGQLAAAIGKGAFPESNWSINWTAVISMATSIPPDNSAPGDVYLIPAAANGAWAGKSGQLAIAQQTGWIYARPKDGHGFALPDGRMFIRQEGSYKEVKFDAGAGALAELTDIDNAKTAAVRAILTKAAKGFTFLTPQAAFEGVEVPVEKVKDLDLTKFAYLEKANTFLHDNSFKGSLSVSRSATFASSVSTVALTASGTATFNAALVSNGSATFNKGAEVNDIGAQEPYITFNIADAAKAGGGIVLSPKSDANSKVTIAYLAGGGLRISTPSGGDIVTIDKSGFITIQGAGIKWGKAPDGIENTVAADGNIRGTAWYNVFGGDKSNKNLWAAGLIADFINRECVRELKMAGYWEASGRRSETHDAGLVTYFSSDSNHGGIFVIGVRPLWYRVGSQWRQPWIG